jgi:hypothetical protein
MVIQSNTEILQTSPLVQRLIRRSTQSLGLIGRQQTIKQPIQLPPAIIQRASMMERLNVRAMNNPVEPMASDMIVHRSNQSPSIPTSKQAAEVISLKSQNSHGFESQFRIRRQSYPQSHLVRLSHNINPSDDLPIAAPRKDAAFAEPSIAKLGDQEETQIRRQRIPTGQIQKQLPLGERQSAISNTKEVRLSTAAPSEGAPSKDLVLARKAVSSYSFPSNADDFPMITPHPLKSQVDTSDARTVQPKRMAKAAEIQAASSNSINKSMVWRTGTSQADILGSIGSASGAGAKENYLQAQPISFHPMASLARSSTQAIPTRLRPQSSTLNFNQTLDLREIAQEVSHILSRQWTVERERRGIGP